MHGFLIIMSEKSELFVLIMRKERRFDLSNERLSQKRELSHLVVL